MDDLRAAAVRAVYDAVVKGTPGKVFAAAAADIFEFFVVKCFLFFAHFIGLLK